MPTTDFLLLAEEVAGQGMCLALDTSESSEGQGETPEEQLSNDIPASSPLRDSPGEVSRGGPAGWSPSGPQQ